MVEMTSEKLHKVLARAGFGSRRQIEKWILQGRVRVNDIVAEVGQRVDAQSRIVVDGKQVVLGDEPSTRLLIYHKPLGEITSRSDPQGRLTVFDHLPAVEGRWVAVGRLDMNSTGLLLFTNNGELAAKLMHPGSGFEREYLVRVRGEPSAVQLESLQLGIELEGHKLRFNSIEALPATGGSNRRYRVTVSEGRNREVRRLWESIGCQVNQLKRVRYGPITLPTTLRLGQWREMKARELSEIHQYLDRAKRVDTPDE